MPIFTLLCTKSLQSCPTLCDPMDCSPQAPLSMKFSRQEYWHGLPCPPPGDLLNPGIEPTSLISPALAGGFFTTSVIWEALIAGITSYYELYFLCSPTSILLISYLHGIIFQSFIYFFNTCLYLKSISWKQHINVCFFSSVQLLSCVQLFATPCTTACQRVHQQLPEFTQLMSIELVMPSSHLILCRPFLLLSSVFPSIRVFSKESALCLRWPKYWSFSFNISFLPMNTQDWSPSEWTGQISL